jgi:hypothetical protein
MIVEPTKKMKKKILSEFTRYIAHKEQPINMGNYLSFARLIIWGCAQPFIKDYIIEKWLIR